MTSELASLANSVLAATLGALVGATELVARYRDAPKDVLRLRAAILYIGLNALAAGIALIVIDAFGWTFGMKSDAVPVVKVAVAGLGAMALFRSALFTVRTGDVDVDAGPHALLKVILGTVDRAVDRKRAYRRSITVKEIMAGVDFDKARQALPAYCLALMQNVSVEEQQAVANEVAKLEAADLGQTIKSRSLGLLLLNVIGEDVLRASIDALSDEIKQSSSGLHVETR